MQQENISKTRTYATEPPDPSSTETEQQQRAAANTISPPIYHTSQLQLGQHCHMLEDTKEKILSTCKIIMIKKKDI